MKVSKKLEIFKPVEVELLRDIDEDHLKGDKAWLVLMPTGMIYLEEFKTTTVIESEPEEGVHFRFL